MFDLSGRSALVTGASGGIGSAIARTLASHGARIVLTGRREDALRQVADQIGDGAFVVAADLSDPKAADLLVKAAVEQAGGVDILVHNAGVTRDGLAMRMSDDDWQHVIDVNLSMGFRLVRACLRGMMRNRWGRVIGVTSIVATTGNPGQINYAASKAGLIGMMKSLAHEVASRGITANCIAPGFVDTDMVAGLPEERKVAILGAIPMGRMGRADDIAAGALFLASEEGAYITGQTLHINGGMTMV